LICCVRSTKKKNHCPAEFAHFELLVARVAQTPFRLRISEAHGS
jgi:hypothetical protein